MNYLSEIYGLITKNDPVSENGGLFLAHFLVLKLMLGYQITDEDHQVFQSKMSNAFVDYGLYLRSKNHKSRTVSQDEQAGFFVTSFILGTTHRFSIWKYIESHFGNYPATGENKFYNPASYYAWSVLADSKIGAFFAPFYTINLLISTNKPKENTSSKLIYFSELFVMKNKSSYAKILWKYYKWRMTKMYGKKWVYELFNIYFGKTESDDFPLLKLSKECCPL